MLKRFFKISQSNINAVMDRFEDPIRMTEQGIRDLKKDLGSAMESLAQVKAIAIRTRKEAETKQRQAEEYDNSAKKLLLKARNGFIDTGEAERLATMALLEKEQLLSESSRLRFEADNHGRMADDLDTRVAKLGSTLSSYDNELATLRARSKSAASTRKINAHLSAIDSSGTMAMLERMKERVVEEESLASAYGELTVRADNPDQEINLALADKKSQGAARLEDLRQRMGMDR